MKIIAAFAIGLALAGLLSAGPAQALNQHSFVSSQGNDANPCTLAAPCRHLQAALTATIAGGEIAVLDTAGYNGGTTVIITQAVSIVNPGGFEAAIAPPSGGTGIVINAGPNDAVSLRGLSIDGAGVGSTGIEFDSGKSLTVENCVIRHVTAFGIAFNPITASSISIANSLVADNALSGIVLSPGGSSAVTAVLNRVQTNNNGNSGLLVTGENSTGSVSVTVSESVAAGTNGRGYSAFTVSGQAPVTITLYHSVSANNFTGLSADGPGAIIRSANSTVTGNTNGWEAVNGGIVDSYGDNYIDGNASNSGPLTPISKQ